jgi:hypothetical protein
MDSLDREFCWIFNVRVLAEMIDRYFYLRCKSVIYYSFSESCPDHSCSFEGDIVLKDIEKATYITRSRFLDKRLISTEYFMLKKMVYSEIISSLTKIFLKSNTYSLAKAFSDKDEEMINFLKSNNVRIVRNKVTQHHDKEVYSKSGFLDFSSTTYGFAVEHSDKFFIKDLMKLIIGAIGVFNETQNSEYYEACFGNNKAINSIIINFININYCKIYIRRLKKQGIILPDNALLSLSEDCSIVLKKLHSVFHPKNDIFLQKERNRVLGSREKDN